MLKKNQRRPKTQTVVRPKPVRWITAGVIIAITAGLFFAFRRPPVTTGEGPGLNPSEIASGKTLSTNSAPVQVERADYERLLERWLRPDGGYVLEIRHATASGKLDAAYFNPQPIRVARAEWQRTDGKLVVFVELRDVNYPGSTYTLAYDPSTDRLLGNYFQAAQGQTFEVEFVRQRSSAAE